MWVNSHKGGHTHTHTHCMFHGKKPLHLCFHSDVSLHVGRSCLWLVESALLKVIPPKDCWHWNACYVSGEVWRHITVKNREHNISECAHRMRSKRTEPHSRECKWGPSEHNHTYASTNLIIALQHRSCVQKRFVLVQMRFKCTEPNVSAEHNMR